MFSRNVINLRAAFDLSQQKLADIVGVTNQAVSKWEAGSDPNMRNVKRLAEHFGVSMNDLVEKEIDVWSLPNVKVPIARDVSGEYRTRRPSVGRVSAGAAREGIETPGAPLCVPDELAARYPDAYFLRVSGDSMNQILPEGTFVLVAPSEPVTSGDIAVVTHNGDDYTLKRVLFAGSTVVLHPESHDPSFTDTTLTREDFDADRARFLKVVWATYPEDMKL